MTIGKALGHLLSLSLALPLGLPGQTLDPKLAPLEALLDKDWRGLMKAPDGSAGWEVVCAYRALWNGKAVRYPRTAAPLGSSEEGTVYWDDAAQQIAFFAIHGNGVFLTGHVSWLPLIPSFGVNCEF